jgi:hypothetical protein
MTEATADSISSSTTATAKSKRNITQQIPASAEQVHKTTVSYWKLVGNCGLLGSSWSATYSTKEIPQQKP